MRTTITIDDELFARASALAGPEAEKPSDLIRETMLTFIRVQSARRLAAMGGMIPDMPDVPRRRAE